VTEYLLSVVGIVLFASVLLGIVPNGKTTELIKSIARMACLIVIVSPIVKLFVGMGKVEGIFDESGIQIQSQFIEYCSEERISAVEESLRKDLVNLSNKVLEVEISWSLKTQENGQYKSDAISIEKIKVLIREPIEESLRQEIETYILLNYGCLGVVEIFENIDKNV
jgi:hypothetical protein